MEKRRLAKPNTANDHVKLYDLIAEDGRLKVSGQDRPIKPPELAKPNTANDLAKLFDAADEDKRLNDEDIQRQSVRRLLGQVRDARAKQLIAKYDLEAEELSRQLEAMHERRLQDLKRQVEDFKT